MARVQISLIALLAAITALPVHATPFFARTYGFRCQACHSGCPRLNAFGLEFKANNFRIPGMEKSAPLAWSKTFPFTAQVQPFYERFSPGKVVVPFTDTQLLGGGLLTRTTAFYLHHSYFIDDKSQSFPTYEFWVQQVLDERTKAMIKIGQFELPYAYSPGITRTTASDPLVFSAALEGNDAALGAPMSGLQFSIGPPDRLRAFLAYGAPSSASSGLLIGERQFFGRFRDLFFRIATGRQDKQIGFYTMLTHPPRDPSNSRSGENGQRYGLDGLIFIHDAQIHAGVAYGENSNPLGNGKHGYFRSAFIEADKMVLPWLGLTGRWDLQTAYTSGGKAYSDAKTIALRIYPYHSLRLAAEYQQLDHRVSTTALTASIIF